MYGWSLTISYEIIMNSKVKTIIGIVVFAILLTGAYFAYNKLSISKNSNEQQSYEDGKDNNEDNVVQKLEAFDFTVYDVDGAEVNLSGFYGKPIIINFWATWCPYCIEEMPLFEEKYIEYKDDIHFLMIDAVDGRRETKEKGQKYIEDNGYTFPVYFDMDLDATKVYEAYSLPTTVFIDKDGYIIAYQPGALTEDLFEIGLSLILE